MRLPSAEIRPLRGIVLMLASVTLFTIMSALIKAAHRVPPGEAVFFRAFLTVPGLLVWYGAQRQIGSTLRTEDWVGHARRGVIGSIAMGLGFAGLKFLPLPEVTALKFATPMLVVIFAVFMLGERVRMIRISAVIIGLLGVSIILWPRITVQGEARELLGAGIVLGSSACAALAQIFVKRLAGREHPAAIVFYFSLTASCLSLLTIPFGWVWPTGAEWGLLLGAGVVGGAGQLFLTSSYRYADAGVLAPFTYLSMLWAVILGWLFFDEVPTLYMVAGSALIIAAGVAIFLRERQLGLRRSAEAKVRAKGWQ
jgi:drug/metabolite transporter (DMT)-like permease